MKRTNQLTIGAAVLFVLLAGAEWKPLQSGRFGDSCTSSGGKWAENHGYRIEKNCAENSSCFYLRTPNAACKTLYSRHNGKRSIFSSWYAQKH